MTEEAKTCRISPTGRRMHGMRHTTEYTIYCGMKQRCYLETYHAYKHYGARGITMCDRWFGPDGFLNFLDDMGPRPSGKTLERKKNDEGYSKENCEWVTRLRQTRNRSVTLKVAGVALADIADAAGLNYKTVYSRFKSGLTGADLTAPPDERKRRYG